LIGDPICKNKKQQTIHKILTKDGIEINVNEHPKLIANSFNEYYINVAVELITKLKSYETNKTRDNLSSNSTDNKINEKPNLNNFMNIN
jgi:hypothetical protein